MAALYFPQTYHDDGEFPNDINVVWLHQRRWRDRDLDPPNFRLAWQLTE